MERAIITISENGRVNIPCGNVWMSEMELVELFRVIARTLRVAIRAIYKSGILNPATTQRCDLVTPASWTTFYNLEVVFALVFRLNNLLIEQNKTEGIEECLPTKRKFSKFFDFLKQQIKHIKLKLRMVNNGIDISDFGYFLLSLHLN